MKWNTFTSPYLTVESLDGSPVYSYTFKVPLALEEVEGTGDAQLFPAPDGNWIAAQWDEDYAAWTVWTMEDK